LTNQPGPRKDLGVGWGGLADVRIRSRANQGAHLNPVAANLLRQITKNAKIYPDLVHRGHCGTTPGRDWRLLLLGID
jgi:hypothetical protein